MQVTFDDQSRWRDLPYEIKRKIVVSCLLSAGLTAMAVLIVMPLI